MAQDDGQNAFGQRVSCSHVRLGFCASCEQQRAINSSDSNAQSTHMNASNAQSGVVQLQLSNGGNDVHNSSRALAIQSTAGHAKPTPPGHSRHRVDWPAILVGSLLTLAALAITVYYGQIQLTIARNDARNNAVQTCISWLGTHHTSEMCNETIAKGPVQVWRRGLALDDDHGAIWLLVNTAVLALVFITLACFIILLVSRRASWSPVTDLDQSVDVEKMRSDLDSYVRAQVAHQLSEALVNGSSRGQEKEERNASLRRPYPDCKRNMATDKTFTRGEDWLEHMRHVHGTEQMIGNQLFTTEADNTESRTSMRWPLDRVLDSHDTTNDHRLERPCGEMSETSPADPSPGSQTAEGGELKSPSTRRTLGPIPINPFLDHSETSASQHASSSYRATGVSFWDEIVANHSSISSSSDRMPPSVSTSVEPRQWIYRRHQASELPKVSSLFGSMTKEYHEQSSFTSL